MIEALRGKRIHQIACGGFHTAAIAETGELYTWGGGEHGQLGHGDKVNQQMPCLVEELCQKHLLVQISCGWSHTVALMTLARYSRGVTAIMGNLDTAMLPR